MFLLIGKIPPPIGGMTIHVARLLHVLESKSFNYGFYDLSNFTLNGLFRACRQAKLIHLHSTNSLFRLLVSLLCKVNGTTLIVTYHGNIGEWGLFRNLLDYSSIKVCSIPIVLNDSSLDIAKKFNKESVIISSFIPPFGIAKNSDLQNKVSAFKKRHKKIYCTNAFDVVIDKNNVEVYGITPIITIFSELKDYGLVFSDPKGNYSKYLKGKGIKIPTNVLVINYPHSFYHVIELTDGVIRATTTDGDSLTVKEALYQGKRILASDCVSRPPGVEVFQTGNYSMLKGLLMNESDFLSCKATFGILDGSNQLLELYSKILQ